MATNYVTAKYQEIYDMGTQAGKTTILGIHTPDGGNVYNMLSGFFDQFRKFRYKGCSVTMVPAAQLPADPLQVSFEAGSLTCDPRDLLNPILFHGCHGESLDEILNNLYYKGSGPLDSAVHEIVESKNYSEASYYAALSDPSFRKFGIQSGAKVSLRPMVHPLALTNPMVPSNSNITFGYQGSAGGSSGWLTGTVRGDKQGIIDGDGTITDPNFASQLNVTGTGFPDVSTPIEIQNQMFSNGLRPLSWLPTWQFVPWPEDWTPEQLVNISKYNISTTKLPRLYMGFFILPPSYTQEMYFRLIITHHFEFKDFSTALTRLSVALSNPDRKVYNETIPEPTSGAKSASLEVVDGSLNQTSEGVY